MNVTEIPDIIQNRYMKIGHHYVTVSSLFTFFINVYLCSSTGNNAHY